MIALMPSRLYRLHRITSIAPTTSYSCSALFCSSGVCGKLVSYRSTASITSEVSVPHLLLRWSGSDRYELSIFMPTLHEWIIELLQVQCDLFGMKGLSCILKWDLQRLLILLCSRTRQIWAVPFVTCGSFQHDFTPFSGSCYFRHSYARKRCFVFRLKHVFIISRSRYHKVGIAEVVTQGVSITQASWRGLHSIRYSNQEAFTKTLRCLVTAGVDVPHDLIVMPQSNATTS